MAWCGQCWQAGEGLAYASLRGCAIGVQLAPLLHSQGPSQPWIREGPPRDHAANQWAWDPAQWPPLPEVPRTPGGPGGRRVALIPACALVRLFEMNLGPPKTLEELDPETREYWRLLRKQNIWRHNRLSKNKKL